MLVFRLEAIAALEPTGKCAVCTHVYRLVHNVRVFCSPDAACCCVSTCAVLSASCLPASGDSLAAVVNTRLTIPLNSTGKYMV